VVSEEAKPLGIVTRLVPAEELMKISQEFAAQIAQYPLNSSEAIQAVNISEHA